MNYKFSYRHYIFKFPNFIKLVVTAMLMTARVRLYLKRDCKFTIIFVEFQTYNCWHLYKHTYDPTPLRYDTLTETFVSETA